MKRIILTMLLAGVMFSLAFNQMPYSKSYYNYTNFGKLQAYNGVFDSLVADTFNYPYLSDSIGGYVSDTANVVRAEIRDTVEAGGYAFVADSIDPGANGNWFTIDSLIADTLYITISGTQKQFIAD